MTREPASMARRIQLDEINAEKRVRMSARVAHWEAESKALAHPMVKIKSLLSEAARQELGRIKTYHDRYLASLEAYRTEQLAAMHQLDSFSLTANAQAKKHHSMTEARLNQKIKALTQAAALKARSLAADVLVSYRRLIHECVMTNERITSEARREGKSAAAIRADEDFLASHVMLLHSSLFPWRDGILFECPSADLKGELIAKGWASVGVSGRLQFHTFAASTVVSQMKQVSAEEKRRVVAEANRRLNDFLLEEEELVREDVHPKLDNLLLPVDTDDSQPFDAHLPCCAFLTPASSCSSDDLSGTYGISGTSAANSTSDRYGRSCAD